MTKVLSVMLAAAMFLTLLGVAAVSAGSMTVGASTNVNEVFTWTVRSEAEAATVGSRITVAGETFTVGTAGTELSASDRTRLNRAMGAGRTVMSATWRSASPYHLEIVYTAVGGTPVLSDMIFISALLGDEADGFASNRTARDARNIRIATFMIDGQMIDVASNRTEVTIVRGAEDRIEVGNAGQGEWHTATNRYRFTFNGNTSAAGFSTSALDVTNIEVVAQTYDNGWTGSFEALPQSVRNRWNLSVRLSGGSNVWANAAFENGANNQSTHLRLDTVTGFASTSDINSVTRVDLLIDGRAIRDASFDLRTTARSARIPGDFTEDDEIIWASAPGSRSFNVDSHIRRVEIETEGDAVITSRLAARAYFVQVYDRATGDQFDTMDAFNFSHFRSLRHIGLPSTATITFNLGFNYWVYTYAPGQAYGGPGVVFLGRSNSQIPVTDTNMIFFFSETELVDTGVVGPGEPPAEGWAPPVDGGPVGEGPAGPNFNPPTGR
jgi:hypothetical protein